MIKACVRVSSPRSCSYFCMCTISHWRVHRIGHVVSRIINTGTSVCHLQRSLRAGACLSGSLSVRSRSTLLYCLAADRLLNAPRPLGSCIEVAPGFRTIKPSAPLIFVPPQPLSERRPQYAVFQTDDTAVLNMKEQVHQRSPFRASASIRRRITGKDVYWPHGLVAAQFESTGSKSGDSRPSKSCASSIVWTT